METLLGCGCMFFWLAPLTVPVAWQAHRRGYSFVLWLFLPIIVVNPIIFLVLLALLPNRHRRQLREKFRTELNRKLSAQTHLAIDAETPPSATLRPGSTAPEHSLGDLPTIVPRDRSIGDDITQVPPDNSSEV